LFRGFDHCENLLVGFNSLKYVFLVLPLEGIQKRFEEWHANNPVQRKGFIFPPLAVEWQGCCHFQPQVEPGVKRLLRESLGDTLCGWSGNAPHLIRRPVFLAHSLGAAHHTEYPNLDQFPLKGGAELGIGL